MAESKVTTSEKACDKVTVTAATVGNTTTTKTNNCAKACNETITITPDSTIIKKTCPCGHFDLDKLAEDSRRAAFKSSNIAAATSNSIVVFSLLILQEILKNLCKAKRLNLDTVFLITSAMALLAEGLQLNNPQPFNS